MTPGFRPFIIIIIIIVIIIIITSDSGESKLLVFYTIFEFKP